jgi:hypothetical protein
MESRISKDFRLTHRILMKMVARQFYDGIWSAGIAVGLGA